jgi:hypothetical protein
MKPLIAAALLWVCSAMAAEPLIEFERSTQVTNGMAAARVVEIMGLEPTQKARSVAPGADLWVWASRAKENPGTVAFAIYAGKVIQCPVKLTNQVTRAEWEQIAKQRNAELAAIVKRKHGAEFLAKEHPGIDPAILAQVDSGEIDIKQGIRLAVQAELVTAKKKAEERFRENFYREHTDIDPEFKAKLESMTVTNMIHAYVDRRVERKKAAIENYSAAHPKRDAKILKAMREGKLMIGMTDAEVRLMWDEPARKVRSVAAAGEVATWAYEQGKATVNVTFRDGVVETFTAME